MLNNFSYVYVEDDYLSREIMSMILRNRMGVENEALFEDSRDFMERVLALPFRPDMFLLDIYITPLDGFEMLKLLRADSIYASAKVIAVTASVMPEDDKRLRTVGFDSVIAKPLSAENLPGLLERILNGGAVWQI